jgi:hypothetical protein
MDDCIQPLATAEAELAQLRRERDGVARMYYTAMAELGRSIDTVDRVRALAQDMREWASRNGAARAYAGRIEAALNGPTGAAVRPTGEQARQLVRVPLPVLRELAVVAAHVSRGREAAGVGERYPDGAARRALGALDDLHLLDEESDSV